MGIKFIIVCFIVLVFFLIYDLIDTLKLREEQNEAMDREIMKQRIQINKLQDKLERYKKLHKIYSDYFYRRDTDEIRNENDR